MWQILCSNDDFYIILPRLFIKFVKANPKPLRHSSGRCFRWLSDKYVQIIKGHRQKMILQNTKIPSLTPPNLLLQARTRRAVWSFHSWPKIPTVPRVSHKEAICRMEPCSCSCSRLSSLHILPEFLFSSNFFIYLFKLNY